MHSRHGSRPDGFRCIAPPRASIPESADSLAHISPRDKGQCLKKRSRAHLRNSPPSRLMFRNNYLKQLAFGARANSPAPICRSSNYYNSECSRCARRIMLFLKVVMVVSKCQYVWVKKRCALGSGSCAGGGCVVGCGWTCPRSGKRRSRRFGGWWAARRDASPHRGKRPTSTDALAGVRPADLSSVALVKEDARL